MHRFIALLFALVLAVPAQAGKLRVVATTTDLAAVASQVGGDHIKVTALSLPTQDPHFVDAKPSLLLELSRADALVVQGLQLEVGWLPTLQTGARNKHIQLGSAGYIDCSQWVELLQIPAGSVSREMGDIHPGGNPHYTFDPYAMIRVAAGLGQRLGQLDPENAMVYAVNAGQFEADLRRELPAWEQRLAALKGAPVVEFHRSWPYLERWLGFEIVVDIEPKPGIPPNPAHVAHVLGVVEQLGAGIILQEVYYPPNTARLIADKSAAELVILPGGTNFGGGQSYIGHIEAVVTALEAGMSK